jgi:hypothetical protein
MTSTDRIVGAPTPGVSRRTGKLTGPRSATAASVRCSRSVKTSQDRTSWCAGMMRWGSTACAGVSSERAGKLRDSDEAEV